MCKFIENRYMLNRVLFFLLKIHDHDRLFLEHILQNTTFSFLNSHSPRRSCIVNVPFGLLSDSAFEPADPKYGKEKKSQRNVDNHFFKLK